MEQLLDRAAFSRALAALLELQHQYTLKEFAKQRKLIPKLVKGLVKDAGLDGDPREGYFRLLATSALMGKEQMYYQWKRVAVKNSTKKSKEKGNDKVKRTR